MKKISALFIIIILAILIFYKSSRINIEGEWTAKEIRFKGKDIYIDSNLVEIRDWINSKPVVISNWTDSIYIQTRKKEMNAHLEIKYDEDKPYAILSSKEKFLNGRFDFNIDTIPNKYINHSDFTVDVKMKSHTAFIHLQRIVYPKPPKKVDFPVRGRP